MRYPRLQMVKSALRSVPVLLAAVLLLSCGGQSSDDGSVSQANLSKAVVPPVQCSDVSTIALGANHVVGLKADGTVVAAGNGTYGQLKVSSWTNIKAVAAGMYHTVGLKADGTVVAVGTDSDGQMKVTSWTKIKAIAAGAYHTVGLKEDGTVVAVGYNGQGQLNVSLWKNIKAIAADVYQTVGLKEDGTVVAVGYNTKDQLNVSTWTNIKAIAAGAYHTVGLREDGTVMTAGDNYYGQLTASAWTNIKAIAASTYQTVGLKEDGTVVAVGYNRDGQLNISSWTKIKAVAAGPYDTVGLREDGTVVAAGYNRYGQQTSFSLFTDIMPICGPAVAQVLDTAAPATTATVTGTPGSNGWYVSAVQVTLTASDSEGGSGVKEVYYTIDGAETKVTGSSASFTIAGDGTHTMSWYAVDNAGNAETRHEMGINIDTTAPELLSLVTDRSVLWPPNHKMMDVFIGGAAVDNGSGVDSTAITVTDEYGTPPMTVANFGNAVQLESWRDGTDRDGRVYTITAVITDKAGNRSTGTTTVLVPHDMR